ncbi:hypothetical protein PUR58_00840 [Streptomyces sp. JV186]|uniref:hypothetical protein n=1 Tax=Streptomyces sp. JV186 TaxID=858639 RepID=UPI002E794DCC|nr:hypothetical protein [Streptomyces sp. JV186]MEE1721558.1 hypothetical protein [Streptomyces sp. JV186]
MEELLAVGFVLLDGGRFVCVGREVELVVQVAGEYVVRWSREGVREVHLSQDGSRFSGVLFERYGDEFYVVEVVGAFL